jgi:hypothetical protein
MVAREGKSEKVAGARALGREEGASGARAVSE